MDAHSQPTCPEGHPVTVEDRFCMECGATLADRSEVTPVRSEGFWTDRQPFAIATGGALIMLSSVLPWFTSVLADPIGTTHQNAFRLDGIWGNGVMLLIVGAAAVVVGLATLWDRPPRGARWIAVVVGAIALVIAIRDARTLIDRASLISDRPGGPNVSVGTGVYVLALGGGLAILGAFLRSPQRGRNADPAPPPTR